ncbi:MAG: cytochrome c maturation protein CcmE [Bacteroidia bacterium]|nr:cytochrome c maturation protein CcmE [Bacteroidia bacterium]
MKPRSILLLVIIALFTVVLAVSFSGNSSSYTTFGEAKKSGGTVHIVGSWVNRESANYDASRDIFTFSLQDTTGTVSPVSYHDPKPNDFDKAEKIVVIGKFETPDVFTADKIIMKCPSKYGDKEVK